MRRILALLLLALLPASLVHAAQAELFPRPAELEPAVRFWTRVYTEVGNSHGFIHDNLHLDVVYETVQVSSKLKRRAAKRKLKKRFNHYRRILKRLAKGNHAKLNREERRVLAFWPKGSSKRDFRKAAKRLRFQRGQSNRFRKGLVRSGEWLPFIRKTLKGMSLPAELEALPHVESSYNPKARSYVGASGMWQFTRSTGRRFMRVDHVVDERQDPFLSSVAAARLLQYNYSILGKWPLAITAYNHGVAGMRRAVKQIGSDDIGTIVWNYKGRTFGFASRNFYSAFLAALDVSRNSGRYFGRVIVNAPKQHRTVEMPAYMRIKSVTEALGFDKGVLRGLNPALQATVWRGDKYVPAGHTLRLPWTLTDSTAALAQIPVSQRFDEQKPDIFHKVRRGDSLSAIARRYKTTVSELVALNLLRNKHRIRAGQVLRLPVRDGSAALVAAAVQQPEQEQAAIPANGLYRVRRGDTLERIARRFNLEEPELVSVNGLRSRHRIYAGQMLKVGGLAAGGEQELRRAALRTVSTTTVAPIATEPHSKDEQDGGEEIAVTEVVTAAGAEVVSETAGEEEVALVSSVAELLADPSDYTVAADHTILVQAGETLGHYAEWLGVRARDLRRLNRFRRGRPVVVGRRLKLTFNRTTPNEFESSRVEYHRSLQADFFAENRIGGTCQHTLREGESLWVLSARTYTVPLWLLRQYNPDTNLNWLSPGVQLTIPKVERRAGSEPAFEETKSRRVESC